MKLILTLCAVLLIAPLAGAQAPKTALPTDLAAVPNDTFAFAHIKVTDLWKNDALKDVRGILEKAGQKALDSFDARFTPAYAKIGVSPDGGSTVGMVGTVGTRRALQIFLAEDSFSAQQAQEWGLVARVVPADDLKAETRKFAERLAQNPLAAISGTKSLVYQAAVTSTKAQLDAEEAKIIDAMHTDEFRIAVKKFTSKSK